MPSTVDSAHTRFSLHAGTSIADEVLVGGGEMGALMRSFDWSATLFGPVAKWPQSLRTAVSIMLASRFGMVVAWGPEFRFLYNDRYRPVLGATKHPGALGAPGAEIFPEIWHIVGPLFEKAAQGEAVAFDDLYLPLDRYGYLENCWFTLSYSPIRDETGGVGGLLAVVAETTERVQGERRLKTLRELGRRAADAKTVEEACNHCIATLAAETIDVPFALLYRIESEGHQARLAAYAGIPAGGAASPQIADLGLPSSEHSWPLAEVASERATRILSDLPQRFGSLPGGSYPESSHSALLIPLMRPGQRFPDGILICGVCPRRALDEQYRTFFDLASDQILTAIRNALAYQEERERAEKLAELDRAKTAFFSNVSHEFRTPLTLMLGPLEELLSNGKGSLVPEHREQLVLTHRNSLRLLKLVNTLLDFSRIEAGRVQANYETTDLATFTAELCGIFRAAVERAGMQLIVDCPPLTEPVYVDREMWEKIVLNLLSNAFKFTFEGEIAVSLRQNGGMVELSVRDTGIGIAERELGNLFERFHRVEGARGRTFEGSGIGLALVQELVQLHGGGISAKSKPAKGTEFTVSIPSGKAHLPPDRICAASTLATTALRAEAFVEEALRWLPESTTNGAVFHSPLVSTPAGDVSVPRPPPGSSEKPSRVLVADDNADMRDYVRRLLSADYQVTAVAHGEAALESARKLKPDLILTDVMMPQLDGFQLLQAIRSDPQLQTIPVILLSARAGEESRVEGLNAGADDYLIKPFSARELVARVESHLKMARLRQEAFARERQLREEIEAQTRKVHDVIESITDGFIALDAEWRFTYINKTGERIIGKPLADLLGRNYWEEYPATLGTIVEREFRRATEEQVSVEFENFYQPWQRWFEIKAYPSAQGLVVYFRDITARKKAEDALAEAQRGLAAQVEGLTQLHELSTRLLSSRELKPMLHSILESIAALHGTDKGLLSLADEHGDFLHVGASLNFDESTIEKLKEVRAGQGACGTAFAERRRVVVEDTETDPLFEPFRELARHAGFRAVHSTPILARDRRVLGVLSVHFPTPHHPTPVQIQIADMYARHAADFMEQARIEAALRQNEEGFRRKARNLEILNRVGSALSSNLDLEKIVQAVTDAGREVTGAAFGAFFYNVKNENGESYMLYTLSGAPREAFERFPMPRNSAVFAPTFNGEGIVRVSDILKDPRYGKNEPYHGMPKGHLPVRSYLAVPVMSRSGEVLGGLFFGHPEPDVFTEEAEQFLSAIASQASVAIDNANLYQALKNELSDSTLLQAISAEIVSEQNVEAIYQKLVDAAVRIMRSDFASMQMFYPERGNHGELRLLALHGFDPDAAKVWEWVGFGTPSSCGEALRQGQRVLASDINECQFLGPDGIAAYRAAGIRSMQSTPLMSRNGKLVGMISTHWRTPHQPTERDLRLFDLLARQAADLIERRKAEDELRASEQRLAAELKTTTLLYQIGNECASVGKDLEGCLQQIVNAAIAVTGADKGNLQLIDQSSGELKIAAQHGFEKPFLDFFSGVHGGSAAACGAAIQAGKRIVVEDVTTSEIFVGTPALEVMLAAHARAAQSTPLVSSTGNLLGMISTHYANPHRPGERELRAVDLLARQAADYLERRQVEEALRQSEIRLRTMAESLPNLVWTDLPNGQCDWLSSQWCKYTGIPEKELLGTNWLDRVIHPADRERTLACWQAACEDRGEYDLEYRIRRYDGQYRWFKTRGVPIRDVSEKITYWFGTCTDIEDIKRAEVAIQRLAAIVEHSEDAIFSTDLEGRIQSWNRGAVRLYGYTAEETIGQSITMVIPEACREQEAKIIRTIRLGRPVENCETQRLRRDGTIFDISLTVSPIKDPSGEIIGVSKVARDITDRKRSFVAAQRLAAIVESSDDAIISKDLKGTILSWNKGAERIFGYLPDEIIGKPITVLMPLDQVEDEEGILQRLRRGEQIEHYETVRRRKDGTLFDTAITISPIRNADGEVIGASKVARDITDKVRSREKLERMVSERTRSLREAIAQMEEFSYSVSHDLRSPVRAMQGYARALIEDYAERLDDDGRDYLDRILQGSARMERLIHDVLTYSRASRMEMSLQPVSLDALVHGVVRQYPELESSKADIIIQKNLPVVIAHEPSLGQAVANLLNNAVKFVAPGVRPCVRVMAERKDGRITLRIQDNGIGIKPEHQGRLFGMFERIHPDEKYEGTGIGLAIVRKTVERMGGKVGVESDGVSGSLFWIQLPEVLKT